MGDVVPIKQRCPCGWRHPANLDMVLVNQAAVDDAIVRYYCPECGVSYSTPLVQDGKRLIVLRPKPQDTEVGLMVTPDPPKG